MPAQEAVRLTLKTAVGDYLITLKLDDARKVLARFGQVPDEPKRVAEFLAVRWLSTAMKADLGRAGTPDAPYLNYQTDSGDWVSLRSTAVMAIEARLVPVAKRMGFGSIGTDPSAAKDAT